MKWLNLLWIVLIPFCFIALIRLMIMAIGLNYDETLQLMTLLVSMMIGIPSGIIVSAITLSNPYSYWP